MPLLRTLPENRRRRLAHTKREKMAKKITSAGQAAEAPALQKTCGECAHAYGYCMPAYDRRPICCRCRIHFEKLHMCGESACRDFEMRTEAVPETVTEMVSEDLDAARQPRKVVPVFDEKTPTKVLEYVPSEVFMKRDR